MDPVRSVRSFTYKRDAVRIKALKIDGNCMPDTKKFSVDPQITSYEVLQSLLSKAFDIKGDFTMCYRVLDDIGQETYLPLLSDWDLDAAFVSAADPCLCLRLETKILEEVGEEWEPNSSFSWISDVTIPVRLQGLMNHVEKTVKIVRGAFSVMEEMAQAVTEGDSGRSPRSPLTDAEFRMYLDPVGELVRVHDLRNAIYLGGIDPSLRKVVWKHLLNVYPEGLSGKDRLAYIKRKSQEYEQLKNAWRNLVNSNEQMKCDLAYVTGMVKKDVLRTDRHHPFFAGNDDNQNIVSLFNILTTYALNHPSVNYCQGMSDLASPLLVTMGSESQAYVCFCALMRRLAPNFHPDGRAITTRFQHLSDALQHYDPAFYHYLKSRSADDLLFCYRWLLLEMKREFSFEDSLRMLEVMWSSLPPPRKTSASEDHLPLFEIRFGGNHVTLSPLSPLLTASQTPYTKVCALRRQSSKERTMNRSLDESAIAKRRLRRKQLLAGESRPSAGAFRSLDESALPSTQGLPATDHSFQSSSVKIVKTFNEFFTLDKNSSENNKNVEERKTSWSSSPEDEQEYHPMCTSVTEGLSRDLHLLEQKVFELKMDEKRNSEPDAEELMIASASSNKESTAEEVFVWENPLVNNESNCHQHPFWYTDGIKNGVSDKPCNGSSFEDGDLTYEVAEKKQSGSLPDPWKFGGGNPFLILVCVTVLCQHRDIIMNSEMDYNEIAIHFDKMIRKHNVTRVLNRARVLYANYLKHRNHNFLRL